MGLDSGHLDVAVCLQVGTSSYAGLCFQFRLFSGSTAGTKPSKATQIQAVVIGMTQFQKVWEPWVECASHPGIWQQVDDKTLIYMGDDTVTHTHQY